MKAPTNNATTTQAQPLKEAAIERWEQLKQDIGVSYETKADIVIFKHLFIQGFFAGFEFNKTVQKNKS